MKIVSATLHLGDDGYLRINADGSYSALAFGSFGPNQKGLKYDWIAISEKNISAEAKKKLKDACNV